MWYEPLCDLQMVATCTGLAGGWDRLSSKLMLAATSAGLGAALQEVWDTLKPVAAFCEPLRDFSKIHSMSQDRPFVWKSHCKWLG